METPIESVLSVRAYIYSIVYVRRLIRRTKTASITTASSLPIGSVVFVYTALWKRRSTSRTILFLLFCFQHQHHKTDGKRLFRFYALPVRWLYSEVYFDKHIFTITCDDRFICCVFFYHIKHSKKIVDE